MKISHTADLFNSALETIYIDSLKVGTIENKNQYFLVTSTSGKQANKPSRAEAINFLVQSESTGKAVINQVKLF